MGAKTKFLLYRIWYGDSLVYVGRTKQPLQSRIRGHLFAKPMHRVLDIEQITKIEYSEFQTEADMNLYEIYFILIWHPPLNVDDKTPDKPTVELPPVKWTLFETPLWEKWRKELGEKLSDREKKVKRLKFLRERQSVIRSLYRQGQMTAFDLEIEKDSVRNEIKSLETELYGRLNW